MKLRIALSVCTLTVLFAAVPAFADDASATAKKEQEITKLLVDSSARTPSRSASRSWVTRRRSPVR